MVPLEVELLKEVFYKCSFFEEGGKIVFSVSLDIIEDFERKHGKGFFEIWDELSEEERHGVLNMFYKK